ncbi:hypothetical protein PUNSTDRAFT_36808, partial [Punctularia strigosozonata HHB-11173 SS5]|uniref:uncharacterized protein n=1 Tax=Punctularia strigosozonata (strain HHB-11173) TaxID=741275 RepID=UPI0004417BE0
EWDGWPDGNWSYLFSAEEVAATSGLMVHWAHRVGGGSHRGRNDAETWVEGKKSDRTCHGVIVCGNADCVYRVRPHARPKQIPRQLEAPCPKCKWVLKWIKCGIKSYLHTFKDGIYYINVGALGLLVGAPTRDGVGRSVAQLSDVWRNRDRVQQDMKRVLASQKNNGDGFVTGFAQFQADYADYLLHHIFGVVTVLSLQDSFMRHLLVKETILGDPINGLVTDAAHGYWADKKALLIISSTYSPDLNCWVPTIASYSNGASAEHYKQHFIALFESIAMEAEKTGVDITDQLFLNASNLSFDQAQRNAFLMAYCQSWEDRDDRRTTSQRHEAAKSLLRGCGEHFRAAVTRIKRIHAVVQP